MCLSSNVKSSAASGQPAGPTHEALKNRLHWRIRRARRAMLERARAQVSSVKLSQSE